MISFDPYSRIIVANSVTSSNGMTSTLTKLQSQIASGRQDLQESFGVNSFLTAMTFSVIIADS